MSAFGTLPHTPPATPLSPLPASRPRRRPRAPRARAVEDPDHCPLLPASMSGPDSLFDSFLWQGDPATTMASLPFRALPSPWRVLVLSDGSVTRHLELLTGRPSLVDCLDMSTVPTPAFPDAADLIAGPHVRRQVVLRRATNHGTGHPQNGVRREETEACGPGLVYAASWWNADTVQTYMAEADQVRAK